MAKEHGDYYAVSNRKALREVKSVGAMPFILYQYYLTWLTAPDGIRPPLQMVADDLGIEKNAVCNLRAILVEKEWITYEKGEVKIIYEPGICHSEKMNEPAKRSEILNDHSEKMNGTEVANKGFILKDSKENSERGDSPESLPPTEQTTAEEEIHYEPCDEDGLPLKKKQKSSRLEKRDREPRAANSSASSRAYPSKAVQIVQRLMGGKLQKVLWEKIDGMLPKDVDEGKLKACWVEWCSRGHHERGIGWIDWYVNGLPPPRFTPQVARERKAVNADQDLSLIKLPKIRDGGIGY